MQISDSTKRKENFSLKIIHLFKILYYCASILSLPKLMCVLLIYGLVSCCLICYSWLAISSVAGTFENKGVKNLQLGGT